MIYFINVHSVYVVVFVLISSIRTFSGNRLSWSWESEIEQSNPVPELPWIPRIHFKLQKSFSFTHLFYSKNWVEYLYTCFKRTLMNAYTGWDNVIEKLQLSNCHIFWSFQRGIFPQIVNNLPIVFWKQYYSCCQKKSTSESKSIFK